MRLCKIKFSSTFHHLLQSKLCLLLSCMCLLTLFTGRICLITRSALYKIFFWTRRLGISFPFQIYLYYANGYGVWFIKGTPITSFEAAGGRRAVSCITHSLSLSSLVLLLSWQWVRRMSGPLLVLSCIPSLT